MKADVIGDLEKFGALRSQIVDLESDREPRVLRYLDLSIDPAGGKRPLVVESADQPRLHVYDARDGVSSGHLEQWCRRTALRGDGARVAVLEPGRLTVYATDVVGDELRLSELDRSDGSRRIVPAFLYDTKSGEIDLAARGYLVRLLRDSLARAKAFRLSDVDALSLVGRGLFWRFLLDRGLLKELAPSTICAGARSWPQCLDAKARALRTFSWLDRTFNGGLLPFSAPARSFDDQLFSEVLGNIAHGAEPTGQLRLPTDWKEVHFGHIPVGLLSEVYEAFWNEKDRATARSRGIHYTPRHIAEFLVAEALATLPAATQPRVLDPAAGAGVFLVAAFRQLAERRWAETGHRPGRAELRAILANQLTGFEIDPSALRLAELALYLTALELDPDPRPPEALRFDELRDRVLFELPGGPARGSLDPVESRFRGVFDVVVGNPPWTAHSKGGDTKRRWVRDTLPVVCERLGDQRAAAFDFPDTNPDLPFVWRAMEWLKPSGRIALVTHARWLFGISDRFVAARRDLLDAVHVTGILNGSALRFTRVWPNVSDPFCLLFAANEKPPAGAGFYFVSPALETVPDKNQARLRIDWQDAQVVPVAEVQARPWALKTRFRGNRMAERAVVRMMDAGIPFEDYLATLGDAVQIRDGYQVGGTAGKQVPADHLRGLPDLRSTRETRSWFVVDPRALPRMRRATLLFPRPRSNYRAPLLLLHETIPADRLSPRALRAEEDVAYSESFHGVSLVDAVDATTLVRYLQLVLQSGATVFFELLSDARYGAERDTVYLESVRRTPVVPFAALGSDARVRCLELSKRLESGMTEELANEIDDFVFGLFDLSAGERDAVRDALATALPSTTAKRESVRVTRPDERATFIATLADSLNRVMSASDRQVFVSEREDLNEKPWRLLQVDMVPTGAPAPAPARLPVSQLLASADDGGASLVSVRVSHDAWLLALLDRKALWTRTRGRLLATDFIAQRSRVEAHP